MSGRLKKKQGRLDCGCINLGLTVGCPVSFAKQKRKAFFFSRTITTFQSILVP